MKITLWSIVAGVLVAALVLLAGFHVYTATTLAFGAALGVWMGSSRHELIALGVAVTLMIVIALSYPLAIHPGRHALAFVLTTIFFLVIAAVVWARRNRLSRFVIGTRR